MAKVTRLGWGAAGSNFDDPEYRKALEEKGNKDAKNAARREKYAEEKAKEAQPSVGTSSTKSSEKLETSQSKRQAAHPKPAPSTGHRSKPAHKASSTADSAATNPQGDK